MVPGLLTQLDKEVLTSFILLLIVLIIGYNMIYDIMIYKV